MTALAEASFHGFRALVYDDPAFEDFFWSVTPISEIVGLNIGSRPARPHRQPQDRGPAGHPVGVQLVASPLHVAPGWYGFALGVERAGLSIEQLRDLAGDFDFFASLLSNMELAPAQSHMGIAARYVDLSPDKASAQRIFATIQRESRGRLGPGPGHPRRFDPAGQPAGPRRVGGPGRPLGRPAEPPAAGCSCRAAGAGTRTRRYVSAIQPHRGRHRGGACGIPGEGGPAPSHRLPGESRAWVQPERFRADPRCGQSVRPAPLGSIWPRLSPGGGIVRVQYPNPDEFQSLADCTKPGSTALARAVAVSVYLRMTPVAKWPGHFPGFR
ncbi:phosphoenolpyruvate carboxylase [Caulobacter segnis]